MESLTWQVDTTSESGIVFSRIFSIDTDNSPSWIDVYDWCNASFDANSWHFWYDVPSKNKMQYVIGNFEFLNEQDAVLFQVSWG